MRSTLPEGSLGGAWHPAPKLSRRSGAPWGGAVLWDGRTFSRPSPAGHFTCLLAGARKGPRRTVREPEAQASPAGWNGGAGPPWIVRHRWRLAPLVAQICCRDARHQDATIRLSWCRILAGAQGHRHRQCRRYPLITGSSYRSRLLLSRVLLRSAQLIVGTFPVPAGVIHNALVGWLYRSTVHGPTTPFSLLRHGPQILGDCARDRAASVAPMAGRTSFGAATPRQFLALEGPAVHNR